MFEKSCVRIPKPDTRVSPLDQGSRLLFTFVYCNIFIDVEKRDEKEILSKVLIGPVGNSPFSPRNKRQLVTFVGKLDGLSGFCASYLAPIFRGGYRSYKLPPS